MLSLEAKYGQRDDDGFTVVELLVVMVITGVIGAIVLAGVLSATSASSSAEDRMRAMNDLQAGVERVGRELRAATSLSPDLDVGAENAISAVVRRDGDRWRFDYYLEKLDDGSTALLEDITRFDGDSSTILEQREGVFITDIANNETGTPLLRYYNRNTSTGYLEQVDCGEDPNRCATAKQVELSLQKILPGQDPIGVQTVVNVRNMRYELPGE